jgi:heme/copper-type cytochrome/quinol oxidase subunit 2
MRSAFRAASFLVASIGLLAAVALLATLESTSLANPVRTGFEIWWVLMAVAVTATLVAAVLAWARLIFVYESRRRATGARPESARR